MGEAIARVDASAATPAPAAGPRLSVEAQQRNLEFFCKNIERYKKQVESLDTYARLREAINRKIAGIEHLLDIGNGGVFDYDTSLVTRVTALDIFFDKLEPAALAKLLPPNVTPVTGSALQIPAPDGHHDGVLMVMLLHHLVGDTSAASRQLLRQTLQETHRVLKPGGRLVIAESCVPRWFYRLETVAYDRIAKWINKLGKHPATLQYTAPILAEELGRWFANVEYERVPKGRWILQFGVKTPAFLTPVQQHVFVARKG